MCLKESFLIIIFTLNKKSRCFKKRKKNEIERYEI